MRFPILLWLLFVAMPVTEMFGQQGVADTVYFDEVAIRYVDRGQGTPILLLHALTERLEVWQMSGVMPGLIEAGYRVIAFDCRGHGGSEKLYDPESYFDEEVADVFRLLDHLEIDRAHLAGYSRGSEIASHALVKYPQRILSVTFGGWAPENPVASLSQEDCHAAADSLNKGAVPTPLLNALMMGEIMPQEQQEMMMDQIKLVNDMKAIAAAFQAGCSQKAVTLDRIKSSGVPASFVVGIHDGIASGLKPDRLDEEGLHVYLIEGADHFSARAHPGFLNALIEFLQRI
jgi:pimeloyl-ACP methyl ester carboxylesterase